MTGVALLNRRRCDSGRNPWALTLRFTRIGRSCVPGESPPRAAKPLDRIGHRSADHGLVLWIGHQDFLVRVDDRSGLEEDGGHPRVLEDDQLIKSVDAGI